MSHLRTLGHSEIYYKEILGFSAPHTPRTTCTSGTGGTSLGVSSTAFGGNTPSAGSGNGLCSFSTPAAQRSGDSKSNHPDLESGLVTAFVSDPTPAPASVPLSSQDTGGLPNSSALPSEGPASVLPDPPSYITS